MQTPLLHARSKTYAKRGMWIGVASGAVVGGVSFAAIEASTDCSGDVCSAQGVTLIILGGTLLGGLVGMGIGAIVGGSIKKKEPVALAPLISVKEDKAFGGLVFRKRF